MNVLCIKALTEMVIVTDGSNACPNNSDKFDNENSYHRIEGGKCKFCQIKGLVIENYWLEQNPGADYAKAKNEIDRRGGLMGRRNYRQDVRNKINGKN